MECGVCGFLLGDVGKCPACGSEELADSPDSELIENVKPIETDSEKPEEANSEEFVPETLETAEEELITNLELPFGLKDAPSAPFRDRGIMGLAFAPPMGNELYD